MTHLQQIDEVRGKTMRWTWTEGLTKGETHEHVFHQDGTVEWRAADEPKKDGEAGKVERPRYAAMKIADGIYLVSYLADSGYTLTTALNFHDHEMVGIASNEKMWSPVRGTFEIVH